MSLNNYRIATYKTVTKEDFKEIRELSSKQCVFCEPHPLKIILESGHFYVSLDSSPLIMGHLLIHSKEHIGCAGEVFEPAKFDELEEIKNLLAKTCDKLYGNHIFFEHGRAGHCGIKYGLDQRVCHHFHLHILPEKLSMQEDLANRFEEHKLKNYSDIVNLYDRLGHYLYFENVNGDMYYYPADDSIESHLLRTIISNKLETPEKADWQHYHNCKELNEAKKLYIEELMKIV